jgi:integrase
MVHLTQDEIIALIREIPKERQKLMIAVGYLHGLRVSELIALTKANIRDGYVTVQRLKGSMKTTQPYVKHPEPELDESGRLAELANTLKQHERLFPMTRNGVLKLMQRAGARAGIPAHKLHPHALKHACAKESIDKIGIQRVRQYLGHRSISSTGEYLKESDESASKAFLDAMMG